MTLAGAAELPNTPLPAMLLWSLVKGSGDSCRSPSLSDSRLHWSTCVMSPNGEQVRGPVEGVVL